MAGQPFTHIITKQKNKAKDRSNQTFTDRNNKVFREEEKYFEAQANEASVIKRTGQLF